MIIVAATLASPTPALAIPAPTTFSYTGSQQSYAVPSGVVMVGLAAEGGHGGQFGAGGGREGGVGALLPVTPGQSLFAEVGAAGVYNGGPVFGGGGAAGAPPPVICMGSSGPCNQVYASSGGGASDVRTCSMSAVTCPGGVSSAATRMIVGGGGGGEPGGGNAPGVTCVGNGFTGAANNFQYPPGNPSGGHPVPIITSAGIVYPADYLPDTSQSGITPAGNGSATAGFGGSQAGCTTSGGSVSFSDSVAGSSAVGPVGGTGGNASTLGPMYSGCVLSAGNCFDAGPGGGGGGGYFGGGGGATGVDKSSGNCGTCNGAGVGLTGGGGSGFTSNQTMYPVDESNLLGVGNGTVVIVPAIEIDAPARGAVYTPGQVVDASWSCGYDGRTGLGVSGCTGTVAAGSAIDTSPGAHTFTVSGGVSSNGNHTVTATITYTVAGPAARVTITAAKINSKKRSAKFTFKATGGAQFQCALIKRKKNGKYPKPSFSSCRSPKIYKRLKRGKYKFEVRTVTATSPGTPAVKSFTIV